MPVARRLILLWIVVLCALAPSSAQARKGYASIDRPMGGVSAAATANYQRQPPSKYTNSDLIRSTGQALLPSQTGSVPAPVYLGLLPACQPGRGPATEVGYAV